jgi:Ca2+-dependent lipid-binding protein
VSWFNHLTSTSSQPPPKTDNGGVSSPESLLSSTVDASPSPSPSFSPSAERSPSPALLALQNNKHAKDFGPGIVKLTLNFASGVSPETSNATDVYATAKFTGQKREKTKVFKKSRNPLFDETFNFFCDNAATEEITLSVKESHIMHRNKLLGSVTIPLTQLLTDREITRDFACEGTSIVMNVTFSYTAVFGVRLESLQVARTNFYKTNQHLNRTSSMSSMSSFSLASAEAQVYTEGGKIKKGNIQRISGSCTPDFFSSRNTRLF